MTFTAAALESRLEKVRELEGLLTFRLAVVSKLLDQQASELLADTPLNLTAYRLMTVVRTFDAISISDISRFNAIDRAQISRTAVALERQGLVEFREDAASRRKKLVALTAEGLALLDRVRLRFEARQRALVEGLGPEAYQSLSAGMAKLAGVVQG